MTARGARNLVMACIVAIAATAAGGGPASASTTASAGPAWKAVGAPHIMRPFDHSRSAASTAPQAALTNGTGLLRYGGRPVQVQPKVYLDFWGVAWNNPAVVDSGGYNGVQAQNYIEAFLGDIGGRPWFNSQTQYCGNVASGATTCPGSVPHVGTPSIGGVWNDTTTPVLTDDGIALEARTAAAWFRVQSMVDATVLVLTPTGQSYFTDSRGQHFCAYHYLVGDTVYGYIPWMPDAPNSGAACATNAVNTLNDSFGHGHFDGFSAVIGHEVAGTATDPYPGLGWIDASGFETGDKCQSLSTWPMRNAFFGGGNNFFAVQPLWSNSGATCPLEDFGGLSTAHAAAAWAVDHADVFVRGLDNALWYRRSNGAEWSGWAPLGGFLTSAPAAVSWGFGRTDVFARGSDNALWHMAWTGSSWSAWEWLGGFLLSGPGAASWTSNGLDVFAVGGDRAVWHARWNGGWSGWGSLGGVITADPSAVSLRNGTDRVDVFARGQDGQLWQDTWISPSWQGWLPRGGVFTSGPSATSTSPVQLQIYGIGQDNALWHETWNGAAWSAWSSLEGQWSVDPAAISPPPIGGPGWVELFMIGADAATYRLSEGN